MRAIKRIFRSRKARRHRADLMDATSLGAFAKLNGAEQSLFAQSIVTSRVDRESYRRAS